MLRALTESSAATLSQACGQIDSRSNAVRVPGQAAPCSTCRLSRTPTATSGDDMPLLAVSALGWGKIPTDESH